MEKEKTDKEMPRSPYAVFDGESCEISYVDEHITAEELNYLLRNKFISRLEVSIIELLEKFSLLNTKQVMDLLSICYEPCSKANIESSLKKLYNKEFLGRMVIKRDEVAALRYIYMLGKNAGSVVGAVKRDQERNIDNIYDVKCILAANQVIISALKEYKTMKFMPRRAEPYSFSNADNLEYDSKLCINGRDYYVMILRRIGEWERLLCEKLKSIKGAMREGNESFIIVSEDLYQANIIKDIVKDNSNIILLHDRQLHYNGFTKCINQD